MGELLVVISLLCLLPKCRRSALVPRWTGDVRGPRGAQKISCEFCDGDRRIPRSRFGEILASFKKLKLSPEADLEQRVQTHPAYMIFAKEKPGIVPPNKKNPENRNDGKLEVPKQL